MVMVVVMVMHMAGFLAAMLRLRRALEVFVRIATTFGLRLLGLFPFTLAASPAMLCLTFSHNYNPSPKGRCRETTRRRDGQGRSLAR